MKKIFVILILGLSLTSFGQKLKTFNGSLDVGLAQTGNATYTYYEDSLTKEFIKHGTFKFTFKGKGDYLGYNQTITGRFLKGLKNGTWTCVITMTDFGTGNPYTTGMLTITANYKNGYADGNWREVYSYKDRDKAFVHGQYSWKAFDALKTKMISMNFKNGNIVGAVDINDGFRKLKLKGNYNNNSFSIGTWLINDIYSANTTELVFKDNFLYETFTRNNIGKIIENHKYQTEYNIYNNTKLMTEKERLESGFIIDTICGNNGSESINYIIDYFKEFFKMQYFFFDYIDGDLSYKVGLKGGCEIQIKNSKGK